MAFLNQKGLTTHDETESDLVTTALGFVIDGDVLEVRPKAERVDGISKALVPLIRGVSVTARGIWFL